MKSLVDRLASYAEYHRDKRNIATHFIGIPMILVGTQATLARIGIGPLNAAVAATGLATRIAPVRLGGLLAEARPAFWENASP